MTNGGQYVTSVMDTLSREMCLPMYIELEEIVYYCVDDHLIEVMNINESYQ